MVRNLLTYTTVVKRLYPRRALKRARQLPRDVLEVAGTHDVVAIEDGARLVPGDLHRDTLRDARVDHVAHGGAPEVVAQAPGDAGSLARRGPCLSEIAPALAPALASAEEREEVRDDPVGALLEGLDALALGRQQRLDLRREVHEAPLVVLRRAGVQTQRAGLEVEL